MDNFLQKIRVKFSGLEEENQEDPYNTGIGRIPPKKTVSFKGERKKAQNWFQRQFSGQMSETDDYGDGEFVTAVAAAAFAVNSLEEELSPSQKKSDEELRSLTKSKSKREEGTDKPTDYSKISRWFSGKEAKQDGRSTGESSMRKTVTVDQQLMEDSTAARKVPEKAMGTKPSVKKTPTFPDKYLTETGSKRFEQGHGPKTGQHAPSTTKPTPSSSKVETQADAWEKEKIAKIKKRYEKLIQTILEWEDEKKTKAKRRMERKEKQTEQRRAWNLQEFRNEISRIDKIASDARAAADERKRNDEQKTIAKANVLRSTGKLPRECFCC